MAMPPAALLARADAGARARYLTAAQRAYGNAYLQRQIKDKPRAKWMPKPEKEWTQQERDHVASQRASQVVEAGRITAKYATIAKEKLEKARVDFSALELGKEHKEVPSVQQTKLTKEQVAGAYAKAWQKAFGSPIPTAALRILVGKWVAEGGEKGIYGYNVGNLQPSKDRASEPPIADWAIREAPENTKAGATEQRKSPFYVFKSLEQGVMGVIYWFAGLPRNRPMWAALMFGDDNPRDYVYAMRGCGYFTASVEDIRSPIDGQLLQSGYLNLVKSGMSRFGADAANKILAAMPAEAADPAKAPAPPPAPPAPDPPPPPPEPEPEPPAGSDDGGGGAGGAPPSSDGGGGARGHGPV